MVAYALYLDVLGTEVAARPFILSDVMATLVRCLDAKRPTLQAAALIVLEHVVPYAVAHAPEHLVAMLPRLVAALVVADTRAARNVLETLCLGNGDNWPPVYREAVAHLEPFPPGHEYDHLNARVNQLRGAADLRDHLERYLATERLGTRRAGVAALSHLRALLQDNRHELALVVEKTPLLVGQVLWQLLQTCAGPEAGDVRHAAALCLGDLGPVDCHVIAFARKHLALDAPGPALTETRGRRNTVTQSQSTQSLSQGEDAQCDGARGMYKTVVELLAHAAKHGCRLVAVACIARLLHWLGRLVLDDDMRVVETAAICLRALLRIRAVADMLSRESTLHDALLPFIPGKARSTPPALIPELDITNPCASLGDSALWCRVLAAGDYTAWVRDLCRTLLAALPSESADHLRYCWPMCNVSLIKSVASAMAPFSFTPNVRCLLTTTFPPLQAVTEFCEFIIPHAVHALLLYADGARAAIARGLQAFFKAAAQHEAAGAERPVWTVLEILAFLRAQPVPLAYVPKALHNKYVAAPGRRQTAMVWQWTMGVLQGREVYGMGQRGALGATKLAGRGRDGVPCGALLHGAAVHGAALHSAQPRRRPWCRHAWRPGPPPRPLGGYLRPH